MNARDDSANAVTEMPKITISGEPIRRSRSVITVTEERMSAPLAIETRTAGLPATGEFARYATARSTSRNTPIHVNHGRSFARWTAVSGGRLYDSRAINSRIAITSRDGRPIQQEEPDVLVRPRGERAVQRIDQRKAEKAERHPAQQRL